MVQLSDFPIIRYLNFVDRLGYSTFLKHPSLYIAIAVQSRDIKDSMKFASEMQKGTLA